MEDRFDPFFYQKDFRELEAQLVKLNASPLWQLVAPIRNGSTPKGGAFQESGVLYYRSQDFKDVYSLKTSQCISADFDRSISRSRVEIGDIMLAVVGATIGKVGAITETSQTGNINQNVARIRVKHSDISSVFLASFLNSTVGQKQIVRFATVTTQAYLNNEQLGKILVPCPSLENQNKIIEVLKNGFQSKQQKEQQSRDLLFSIDAYLLNALGISLPANPDTGIGARMFKTSWQEVTGRRLDPKRYSPATTALIASVAASSLPQMPLKALVYHSVAGDWGMDEEAAVSDRLFQKCLVIRATEFHNKYNLNVNNSRAKYRKISRLKLAKMDVQPNDFLLEKSGGSADQPVGRIAILESDLLQQQPIAFSNFIHKFRVDTSQVLPAYLFCFLKTIHNIGITEAMQSQTNGIRNLIMQEYWNQPIILPEMAKQQELAEKISAIRRQAQQLQKEAKEGFEAAKREIEKMILA